MTESEKLFERAKKCIPGGVNSPVRAFGAIKSYPRFITKADDIFLYDEDGKKYMDYVCSWGPMILGHNNIQVREAVQKACEDGLSYGAATKIEVEMAELITKIVPSVEMVRMVNSGTEAVMSAVRLARAYTEKNKIVKFRGCYHGHSDALLVKAGSGAMTAGVPDSAGVTKGCVKDTLLADYNDIESVKNLFQEKENDIAAIIVEPVGANMGVVPPAENFLEELRKVCNHYHALLIFDEVITGFRLGLTGAQGYYKVQPDLTTFGKIIGAGMPVGAYGGKREIMELVAPSGPVYQAGTLSGNPIAMKAGYTQLTILKNHPEYYETLNELSDMFFQKIAQVLKKHEVKGVVNHVGSLGNIFFTEEKVSDYQTANGSDSLAYGKFCIYLMDKGIYLAPSQFEAMFLSMAHMREHLEMTVDVIEQYFSQYC